MTEFCVYCAAMNSSKDESCFRCGKPLTSSLTIHALFDDDKEPFYLKDGTVLNSKYTIKRVIGKGGFGITYEAVNDTIELRVAIKELYCNTFMRRDTSVSNDVIVDYTENEAIFNKAKNRFLKEAKVLGGFSDTGSIVNIIDYFEENKTAYIVMEFVDGVSLDKYLKDNGKLSMADAIDRFLVLIDSLQSVHDKGVIHRDISPDNIIVRTNGTLCLIDFGSAKDILQTSDREKSTSFSKYKYTPIEQYANDGDVGTWSDVYSLTAVLFECVTGECPPDSLQRSIIDEYKPLKDFGIKCTKEIEEVFRTGLAVKKKYRYHDMNALSKALMKANNNKAGKKKKRIIVFSSVAAIFACVALVLVFFYNKPVFGEGEDTVLFYIERDENVAIKEFEKDIIVLENRIKMLCQDQKYVFDLDGDHVKCELPMECFANCNPRRIILDLITRPSEWTIDGLTFEKDEIKGIEIRNKSLVISLSDSFFGEKKEILKNLTKEEAALSVDYGKSDNLHLYSGKYDASLQEITWPIDDVLPSQNLQDLLVYNLNSDKLSGSYSLFCEIKADWETKEQNVSFGKNQCDFEELEEERTILEYGFPKYSDLSAGEILDQKDVIKSHLDALLIPYSFGITRDRDESVAIGINSKDYNKELFFFLFGNKDDIVIEDSMGENVINASLFDCHWKSISIIDEYSSLDIEFEDENAVDYLRKNFDRMREIKRDRFYLSIRNTRVAEGNKKDIEAFLNNKDDLSLSLSMYGDNRFEDDEVLVRIINLFLSEKKLVLSLSTDGFQFQNSNQRLVIKKNEQNESLPHASEEAENKNLEKAKELFGGYVDDMENDILIYKDTRSGGSEMSVLLKHEVYLDELSSYGDALTLLLNMINELKINDEVCFKYISIGIEDASTSGFQACRFTFSMHNQGIYSDDIVNDNDIKNPYTISCIGYDPKETKWIKGVYEAMKSDGRFDKYLTDFIDYSEYYIY